MSDTPLGPGWSAQRPQGPRIGRSCLYSILGTMAALMIILVIVVIAVNHAANNIQKNLGGAPPSAQYTVGQTASSGSFDFTVYSVEVPFEAPDRFAPAAGHEYVQVDVRVQNKSKSNQADFSSEVGFHLLDSVNHQYDATIVPGVDPAAPDGQIAAGQAVRGFVMFEVPQGTSGLKLRCQGNLTAAGAVFSLTSQQPAPSTTAAKAAMPASD